MDKTSETSNQTDLIKELTVQDFLDVGLDQVAYIRHVPADDECESAYIIFGADGAQISVMDSYDTALAAIRINDLFPVTLH